jgi:RNA polymerase sigma factor (TIGR02999 family)
MQCLDAQDEVAEGTGGMAEFQPVTQMLERARQGDRGVVDALMPLIYDELRRLADDYLREERPGHTLQATALVNEAYVRLVGSESGPWQNRAHFFAAAATAIRRILLQHARAKKSLKRGGDWKRVSLDAAAGGMNDESATRIIAVDEALRRLAAIDPVKARLVELRFFAGLSADETAEAMRLSPRTAARQWALARAWLSRELERDHEHD